MELRSPASALMHFLKSLTTALAKAYVKRSSSNSARASIRGVGLGEEAVDTTPSTSSRLTQIRTVPTAEVSKGGEYLRFMDGDFHELCLRQVDFNRCEWVNLRMKKASFEEAKVTKCRFLQCHMRRSTFCRVDLTGTRFIDCDLSHVKFEDSKLWYVEFENCELNYEDLIRNAPPEVNLRRYLFNNLRRNAMQRNESRIANRLLLLEMAAKRLEERSTVLASTPYFKNNFTLEDRVKAFGRLLLHWIELIVWGYGVRLFTLIRSAAIFLLLAAVVSWGANATYFVERGAARTLSFSESIYAVIVTFTTFDDFQPADIVSKCLRTILALAGGVFLGLFAAAAYRRIER